MSAKFPRGGGGAGPFLARSLGERMLDSINQLTLELIKNLIFVVKASRFCYLLRNFIMDVIT